MAKYEDFFITIQGTPGSYTVEARGPGEVSIAPVQLEFEFTDQLEAEIELIAQGFAPSRQRMQSVGSALFDSIFPRSIARAFGRCYDVLPEDTHLRIKLAVRPPELNRLPWEVMFNPDDEYFPATRTTYPLVRYVESGTPVASLLTPQKLRVLYVQAQPQGLAVLNLQASEQALRDGLKDQAEIVSVSDCTPELLRTHLREPFHILHYDGHAFFDLEQQMGALCLESTDGETHHVAGDLLANYLDGTSIRLVVLAACQSGQDSPTKRFSGIAHQIMKSSDLPATVAMQFEVVDNSAIAFNKGFYSALADRLPVEAAVVEGRKAILETVSGDPFAAPDWATPVLFMRVRDGNVLPPVDSKAAGLQAGMGLQALSELVLVSPEIRQAAGEFKTIFEAALLQVDILGDYKDVHDLLHQTQFHCYEPIVNEESRFPDETTLDMLDSYSLNLLDIIRSLTEVANRQRLAEADITWFNDMLLVRDGLRTAVDNEDAGALKKAIWRLKRTLTTQPVRINTRLIDSARALRLPALLDALDGLGANLQTLNLNESTTLDFQRGAPALQQLSDSLDRLLNEHDHWQAIDGEIRRVDSMIRDDLIELEMSWSDLKTNISPLYVDRDGEWAQELGQACSKLDEALVDQNPSRIRRAFRGFRREANSRFFEVDIEVKSICGSLRQIGEPLNAIMRSFS